MVEGGTVMVDNAKVVKTDIGASNGVIHVIDTRAAAEIVLRSEGAEESLRSLLAEASTRQTFLAAGVATLPLCPRRVVAPTRRERPRQSRSKFNPIHTLAS